MSITQEAANVINTLANAASQIGSTPASAKINQLIVSLLPATSGETAESIAEALREDNAALNREMNSLLVSTRITQENLALLRERMEEINVIAHDLVQSSPADDDGEKLEQIFKLSAPISDDPEA